MEIDVIKKRLKRYYEMYLHDDEFMVKHSEETEFLWKELCSLYPQNSFYALNYSLFLMNTSGVYDYIKAEDILRPFKLDVPCIITRCFSCRWGVGDWSVIREYDFEKTISLPMTKQERSLLYYLKSEGDANEINYLKKSIDSFKYNFNAVINLFRLLKNDDEKWMLLKLYYDCERLALYTNSKMMWKKNLLYKPYLYQEMGVLNVSWGSLLSSRKSLGLLDNPFIPSLRDE